MAFVAAVDDGCARKRDGDEVQRRRLGDCQRHHDSRGTAGLSATDDAQLDIDDSDSRAFEEAGEHDEYKRRSADGFLRRLKSYGYIGAVDRIIVMRKQQIDKSEEIERLTTGAVENG